MRRERGSSIIAVFLIAALLATITLLTLFEAQRVIKLYSDEMHSGNAAAKAKTFIINSLNSEIKIPPTTRLGCDSKIEYEGGLEITRSLCQLKSPKALDVFALPIIEGALLEDKNQFPLINFKEILKKQTSCKTEKAHTGSKTNKGFTLSPDAAVNSKSCITFEVNPIKIISLLNIDTNTIKLTQSSLSNEVSAAGYIDTSIEVGAPLLVTAGGDIHIHLLKVLNSGIPITLTSGTGVVVIDRIEGTANLKVIAWEGAFLPSGFKATGNQLLPKLLEREVVYLR